MNRYLSFQFSKFVLFNQIIAEAASRPEDELASNTIVLLTRASRIREPQPTLTVPATTVWTCRLPSRPSSKKTMKRWRRYAKFRPSIIRPALRLSFATRRLVNWPLTITGWASDLAARLPGPSRPANGDPFSLTAAVVRARTIRPIFRNNTNFCSSKRPLSELRCPAWKRISELRDATWDGCKRIWRRCRAPPEACRIKWSKCNRTWRIWNVRSTEPLRSIQADNNWIFSFLIHHPLSN